MTDPAGAVSSATISISVTTANVATSLVVGPATVTKPVLIGNYKYTNLNATLRTTDGSVPIPNQPVGFFVNGTKICQAQTNASGVATCSGTGPRVNSTTYTGKFPGSSGYLTSTGTGPLS